MSKRTTASQNRAQGFASAAIAETSLRAEHHRLLTEAGLKPLEHRISIVSFSPESYADASLWRDCGLPQSPRFSTPSVQPPDSILVAGPDRFLILLREGLLPEEQDFLIQHCLGHLALGHIRFGDVFAHQDTLEHLRNGTPRRWDAQVAQFLEQFLGTHPAPVTETFATEGLGEIWARLTKAKVDAPEMSAALLYQSYKDEFVDVSQFLTEHARLFPHQQRGIAELIARVRRFNATILADSVGLGKTRTTCAVIRTMLDQQQLSRAAILTPRKLERNWRTELAITGLSEGRDVLIFNKDIFKRMQPQEAARAMQGIGLIVVEEAHQDLRNPGNRFHRNLRDAAGRAHGLLVTATPWNNRRGDIFSILSPFVRPVPGAAGNTFECFRKGFRTGRKEFEESDEVFQRVYALTVLQRTRRQLRELGDAGVFYAPREPKLELVPYHDEHQMAFRSLLGVVEALRLPYFNPVRFLTSEKDAEWRLSGTHRFFLLKRAESSMAAFRLTLQGMLERTLKLRDQLQDIKDREDEVGRWLASYYKISEEFYEEVLESQLEGQLIAEVITRPRQKRALRLIEEARTKGRLRSFRKKLIKDCEADIQLLNEVEESFSELFAQDPKLTAILNTVREAVKAGEKVLLISQFADTAFTVYKALLAQPDLSDAGIGLVMSSAKGGEEPVQVRGKAATRDQALRLFAPHAWAQNQAETGRQQPTGLLPHEKELSILIGTDTLSVGQNLQDARVLLHLDLTWNPMVLEQRIGRLDRPRHEQDNAPIQIRYFLNFDLIEAELDLKKRIEARLEATYRDTAFDDEILPGYFELIETMRRLRAERANTQEIAAEIDLLLEQIASARPPDVADTGVEQRRMALDSLQEKIGAYPCADPLPSLVVSLGQAATPHAEIAAEVELQSFDNNDNPIGHPARQLVTLALTDQTAQAQLDNLPQAVEFMLRVPLQQTPVSSAFPPLLREFDRQVQEVSERLRADLNRLREKRRNIQERTRPAWLPPVIQAVRAYLEKLPESQYEAFLLRWQITDDQLGAWLDALAAGVGLDDREMVERLRQLEINPAAILEQFGALRDIVNLTEPDASEDENAPPQQLSFDLEPVVKRIHARLLNLRINLPESTS